jgi:hypothetical protein
MSDVDISDLPIPEADISDLPVPPQSGSWLGAAKGVGQAGLALGAGALKAVNLAANDILPGEEGRAAMRQRIEQDPILNYHGGAEAQPIMSTLADLTRPIGKLGSAVHQGISDLTSPRTADVIGDIATLAPGARGAFSKLEPGTSIEQGHPLSQAAQAESERLGGFKSRGEDLGLDLPEGGTDARHAKAATNNRPVANAAVRNELQLPQNAPLSPQLLDAARTQYASPAYQAVRSVPEIPLGPKYEQALGEIDNLGDIPARYRPPASGSITGSQAVDMSRYLRNKANKYFSAAKGNPLFEDIGQAHWDGAQAVEDAVKDHLQTTGQGNLATAWDNARVYAAKTYSVENALDGAGNVKVTALKQQLLKGKPLSGNLETLANLGAQYPEAFKTTRVTMPQAGPIRKGASYLAPIVGGGIGAAIGGTPGGAIGAAGGEYAAGKILGQ